MVEILIKSIQYLSVALSIHCDSFSSAVVKPAWPKLPFLCI